MAQSYGAKQLHDSKDEFLPLKNPGLAALLGELPRRFIMVIKGYSGMGKTELLFHLTKELCNHGKVGFWSYEQACGPDFKKASRRNNMLDHSGNYIPINPFEKREIREGRKVVGERTLFEDLCLKLGKRGGPEFNIIDSVDTARFSYNQYEYLKREFGKKRSLILVVRSSPNGRVLKQACLDMAFDGQITILVKDLIAFPEKNRYGGETPYVIYEKEARKRDPAFFKKLDAQK